MRLTRAHRYLTFLPVIFLAVLALLIWTSNDLALGQGKSEADKLVAKADQTAVTVAKLRGLKLKKPFARGVMSKAQIKKRILELLAREYTPAELDAESLAMKRFGLIPENVDYIKMMVELLEEQIAGFYDQHEKKLYIAGWAPPGGEMLMAHEIVHALQDQHFDLLQFMKTDKENGDSQSARQALVEGDGMALMLEFQMASVKQAPPWGNETILAIIRQSMEQGMSTVKKVPLALREGLIFPYAGGLDFVAHFRKHHPWKRIDEIYKKPPLSTEHILHPETYESYELPVPVQAKALASLRDFDEKKSLVHGEKGIELFLRSHGVKKARASQAAAGWGGDRAVIYALKGHKGSGTKDTIGVALTSWDSIADAKEFFEALEQALPSLSGGATSTARTDKVDEYKMKSGGKLQAELRGQEVLLVIDVPAARAESVRAELWKTWTVGGTGAGDSAARSTEAQ